MNPEIKLALAGAVAVVTALASAQEVVKIGHVAPLSGPQAHYGKDNDSGVRMAIDDLNAKGVTIGGKKVKLEIQSEDDAADPKQGTAAAQKLCDAKVAGVVGHLNSGTTIPASKVYHDCGIPHVTGAATNPNLTKPSYDTTYRIIANDNALGAALALHAADKLKLKKVAIIDDRTAYGQGVAEEFEKAVKASGKVLFVDKEAEDQNHVTRNLALSVRNTPDMNALPAGGLNVFDVLRHETVIISEQAARWIEGALKK